jgi:Domain of unknown function (DUF397).
MSDFSSAQWRTSSYTEHGNDCVEVAAVPGVIGIRDSKDKTGTALEFSRTELAALMGDIKVGKYAL